MVKKKVGIIFEPKLYAEVISKALNASEIADSLEFVLVDFNDLHDASAFPELCFLIIAMSYVEAGGKKKLPPVLRRYKILAVSPSGEAALRRLPGKDHWEELNPYGWNNLISDLRWQVCA